MFKRLIAIPLCIIFCIAVFSSSVLCAPNNIVTANYGISFQAVNGNGEGGFYFIDQGSNGTVYANSFKNSTSLTYRCTLSTIAPAGSFDLYIATDARSVSDFDFGTLSSYYSPSKNLSETLSLNVKLRELNYGGMNFTTTSLDYSFDVVYLCFSNVPSEIQFDIVNNNPCVPGQEIGTYIKIDNNNIFPVFVFGVFYSEFVYSSNDVIQDYVNGNLSFSEALKDIQDITNSNIANAETNDQKVLESLLGQQQIGNLTQASNDKNLNDVNNTLVPSLNSTIGSFTSGSISLEDSLSDLSSTFDSSLSNADTPEQALLVSSQYQIALKKLELQAQIQAKNRLDSAISDDEMSQFDSYYQTEEDIIQLFDKEEFESKLDYQTWLLQLPTTEAIQYRQFFEYILNDSPWKYFILIPMMMTLVSIVLGTRIRLRGSDEASKSDSFTSSYSGKWDYQNRG